MNNGDFVFEEKITSIAFGSCHKSKYADSIVWNTIAGERPQAFVWTGDAVYPPARNIASLNLLANEYSQMLQNDTIGYKQFLESSEENMQVWGTYDDHDYGGNDRGHEMPNRRDRSRLFWRFLNATRPFPSDDDGQTRQGLYYSVVWPNARLIFLDTRWHRQHHCIPSVAGKFPLGAGLACLTRWVTAGMYPYPCLWRKPPKDAMLGPQQWKWLQEQLASAGSHQLDIVVSSVQVLTTNPAMESWGQFPEERHRLLQLLRASDRKTLLLSGDVHHGELSAAESILEATSSGLTHECSQHLYGSICRPLLEGFSKHRLSPKAYYIGRNYGTIDLKGDHPRVNIHNVSDGSVVLSSQLDSRLAAGPAVPCLDGHLLPLSFSLLAAVAGGMIIGCRHRRYSSKGKEIPTNSPTWWLQWK